MTYILGTNDYPSIRTILSLTADDITDNDFSTAGIVPLANSTLLSVVPDYSLLSGNDAIFAKGAAVYLAAAFTTPIARIRNGKRFKIGDFEEQDNKVDWDTLGDSFMTISRQMVNQISSVKAAFVRPTLFVANGPTTSGSNWPTYFNQWRALIMPQIIVWAAANGVDQDWFMEG